MNSTFHKYECWLTCRLYLFHVEQVSGHPLHQRLSKGTKVREAAWRLVL